MTGRGSVAKRAAEVATRQTRIVSEGRYRITMRPDGALVIAWYPEQDGGGVITLPPAIGRLIDRAAAGEEISPATVLRAMRGGRG